MAAKNSTPIYMQVAVDVAGRISREELKVGQKIIGRTTLASEYSVSPETIRKAMRLLEDVNIVEVKHGNGIYVSSIREAEAFIERYRIRSSVNDLKLELLDLMRQRDGIEKKMNETMNSIVDYTSRFKNSEHITVFEYHLNVEDNGITKTIGDLDLRRQTGITLVGYKRNGEIHLSPSEDECIRSKDKLFYVGSPSASVRLGEYLRSVYEQQ